MIKACGPVKVLPEKTRIAFQVRMSFIAVQVRRNYLIGHFVFARRLEHPRFTRVESFSPRNHLHAFRLDSLMELDDEFAAWVREAYAVGIARWRRARLPPGCRAPPRSAAPADRRRS